MPFSKYDPERPDEGTPDASSASAARRVRVLRYVTWLVTLYTAMGFVLLAYWYFTA